ncbi:hypothetical protein AcW1_006992 [Taiwanofungus camphoratus]|nr:hypothetical protein AcV5_002793 [Antrodia cinnamomea]KAI0955395.1 hypothetical protein AcW1_006992 [Antrodia cinnamomea]
MDPGTDARAVITYATKFKENEHPIDFLKHVALALHFSAALHPPDYQHIRSELLAMIGLLQKALNPPDTLLPFFLSGSSALSVLLSSLLKIAKRHKDMMIVDTALVHGLKKRHITHKSSMNDWSLQFHQD